MRSQVFHTECYCQSKGCHLYFAYEQKICTHYESSGYFLIRRNIQIEIGRRGNRLKINWEQRKREGGQRERGKEEGREERREEWRKGKREKE